MNATQRLSVTGLLLLVVVGCVTGPSKPEYKASEVIERQEGSEETPAWAMTEEAMTEASGNVVYTSRISMQGNARPDACLKGAELDGRSGFLRHVKESLTSSGQLNDTDASSDPGIESLTAFLSQGDLSGVKTIHRYWDRREESEATTGERILRLHCVVQVAIKKSELQRQIQEAIGSRGNQQIRQKLLEAQSAFLDSVSNRPDASPAH